MTTAGLRKLATAWCLAATLAGCTHPNAGTASDPDVDSLMVSVDDVRSIADLPALAPFPAGDLRRPASQDADTAGPCRPAYDQEAAFGTDWTQFRSVTYNALVGAAAGSAKKMYIVTQAVGSYADDGAARAAFERLVPALTACAELRLKYYDFTVRRQDSTTVALDYPNRQSNVIYRVKSDTLIDIVVQGFPQSEHIAETVLQTIADRIT